ncbi:cbb3-type cytochrome c oxidase subunit I [Pelagicoccus sp. SDUM812003]|uniref:cbb3-type cytochrome c oxidase subunit I n=1 Tax=Pelagicoccus sp. SDUM812003 TaxID=3041267 RepID=UPI00280F9062|nr:cbb3-type cytochrome c oxidase subunit I [Pelagicoccus sp. SDUM812003]MDQ8203050.1 cbb3-type cytochrome c oxidase subunit I [Pelagicoccus sp. SDUM812003]
MLPIAAVLLAVVFLVSILALLVLIWSISSGQFSMGPGNSSVIFHRDEAGKVEDPASTHRKRDQLQQLLVGSSRYTTPQPPPEEDDPNSRRQSDESTARATRYLLGSACFWLVLGSFFGLAASLKFNFPDWLNQDYEFTFGVFRSLHLNLVIYGWVSMAGMGVCLWLIPRLLKTTLGSDRFALMGGHLWNAGLVLGSLGLFAGKSDGIEWLEFPWKTDLLFAFGGALIGLPILSAIKRRKVKHLYVSVWYIGAAFVWFPFLFIVANLPIYDGVQHAIVNWWYAHNVLGLWITPFGLAAAYYFIPKVIGKPIHSYQLSLLGFWALALFYSQVGLHHLIGGPVPTWLVSLSIVSSVMMIVPVVAVAINHHKTMWGHFAALRLSPTLLFVVSGAIMYTLVSLQGSLQSLRAVNTVTHFTHATVAHAHLGVYGFASFVLFGSIYFIFPRLSGRNWISQRLISLHYALSLIGILLYGGVFFYGGVIQGMQMQDASVPFSQIVADTKPYLWVRTVAGALMTLGHLVFVGHIWWVWYAPKSKRSFVPIAKEEVAR